MHYPFTHFVDIYRKELLFPSPEHNQVSRSRLISTVVSTSTTAMSQQVIEEHILSSHMQEEGHVRF